MQTSPQRVKCWEQTVLPARLRGWVLSRQSSPHWYLDLTAVRQWGAAMLECWGLHSDWHWLTQVSQRTSDISSWSQHWVLPRYSAMHSSPQATIWPPSSSLGRHLPWQGLVLLIQPWGVGTVSQIESEDWIGGLTMGWQKYWWSGQEIFAQRSSTLILGHPLNLSRQTPQKYSSLVVQCPSKCYQDYYVT